MQKNVTSAHTIAENLEKRMQSILQTKVCLAALVDSRSRILLNSNQTEEAKQERFVYKRLKKVHNDDKPSFSSDENLMSITKKLQSLKTISTRLLEPPSKIQIRH